jgi:hypothetical protein
MVVMLFKSLQRPHLGRCDRDEGSGFYHVYGFSAFPGDIR